MIFDRGNGPPLIVIPGIQGRWEWMKPALRELQRSVRTVSYTLSGDPGSGRRFDRAAGFDNYLRQLDEVFETAHLERASVCGISYGGLIALRYAATRPERVTSLAVVSSPAPGWVPTEQQRRYVARPWLSTPAFVLTSPGRIWPEIRSARGTVRSGLAFAVSHAARVLAAPMMPSHMAARVTLQQELDFAPDCAAVRAPTLVVTGDEALDRVVPARVTRCYVDLIAGARHERLDGTGHLGLVTQPQRFARVLTAFVREHAVDR
jgi:3-oxoadipate enol-lactonase